MIRKIKRNMAKAQLSEEGRRQINKRATSRNCPKGKLGANRTHSVRRSTSSFSYEWKDALKRRLTTMSKRKSA